MTETPILELDNISKHFPRKAGMFGTDRSPVRAVDGISLSVARGETLAVVGESGCGKSTTARLALRLQEPTSGRIFFEGKEITHYSDRQMRDVRARMQIIFQDPYASLNPRMRVREILEEPMVIHGLGDAATRKARVLEVLGHVGLAEYHLDRYPHEFSGGQRQRIGIARALMLNPSLIICDEPVSALDVSIQAQITNLLKDLKDKLKLSFLFIAHDLSVVRYMADRVAVMHLGRIVEITDRERLFRRPCHPYTRTLLAAVPRPDPHRPHGAAQVIGEPPSPIAPPPGCHFHPRCPLAIDICKQKDPQLGAIEPGRKAACHRASELLTRPLDLPPKRSSPQAQRRLDLLARARRATAEPAD